MKSLTRHAKPGSFHQLLRTGTSSPLTTVTQRSTQHVINTTRTVNSWNQTRSYPGTRSPIRGPPRAPKVLPSKKLDRYKISQLSPRDFEQAMRATGGEVGTLTPEEYYEWAKKFADAIHRGPRGVSLAANNIPAKIAHEMACLLRIVASSGTQRQLATSLWKSASEANYNPSTVSLARDILLHGKWGESEVWKDVENRFVKLVAEGKDCNALTAYGESLFNAGKYDEAVETLKQAVSVDDGIFGWKRTCLTCLAKSYAMIGKVSEAKETLKTLGDADADVEIDQFLNTSDAERARQQMYSAALMGRTEMYRQLAEFEFERATNETDKESKKNQHLWGMEWSRLADPGAKF
ncbi:hypothetical protein KAF25_007267 [Fusarium avenaceum]|uniref:Uncharacterized protein n=1 Tax=Fusarium avenaceum TaxID=40199 RepID=A0A9P7GYX7_9HYPO|nr:hypothetical protein KAF25_007267 [Fusarium avenaceum]